MLTPILTTKLYMPLPRPGVVPRPRLIERLNNGLTMGCKLTLISAPAGFGKTTLVSEWAADGGQPVAWLSLDNGDNDSACFLTYLVAALQTVAPKVGEKILDILQSSQNQPPIESLLTTLLNELTTFSDSIVLVLDDYHLIENQSLNQALIFMIDHMPPHLHLVIATREDPPFPLARYRARGQLTELRAADLRFTPGEAADFLNRVMGLNLSAEDIDELESRTEGWIAGLQLAALSIQGREDIAGFIRAFTGSHRFVLDYLVEEVLQHQTEHIRSFLLQTAILDRFCAPLCNAVNEQEDGNEMLDVLERGNLFLIPLDDQRQWYRYHHLFAEVLQTHLMEAYPDRIAGLQRRASGWYERNGLPSDAIHHALAASDFEHAAGLIELAWPAAEEGSIRPAAWLGWVKRLPDVLVRSRPVLSVWYAYALLGIGEMEAAEARLNDAELWSEPSNTLKGQPAVASAEIVCADREQLKTLPAAIAVGRAYIAQAFSNIADTVKYARRALEVAPPDDHLRRGQASMLLGITYWANGDLEAADRVFSDYTLKLRTAGNIPDAIDTTVVVADIRLTLGRIREAVSTLEQLLQFVMDQGGPISPDAADLHLGLSELYLELGSQESASQHLQRSRELGEKAELPVWRYRWCIARARLDEIQGDLAGALSLLDEAERLYIRTPLPNFRSVAARKARIWVAQGRLPEALEWVRRQGLSPDDDISYLREFDYITLTRILTAQYRTGRNGRHDRMDGSIQAVMRLLDRLLQAVEKGKRVGSMIEILVMQALAYRAQGSLTPALISLEQALALAEPEGYVRVFADEGQPMVELLKRIEAKEVTPRLKNYVFKLLSAFNISTEAHSFNPASGGSPAGQSKSSLQVKQAVSPQPLIEPLSEREMEVLRLLRSDLSGPEIALECMVSLSTVRTHTQRIYAKLGVNNRRAAVRRAEALHLL